MDCLMYCILIVVTGAIGIGLLSHFVHEWRGREKDSDKRPNELKYKEDTEIAWKYHEDADRQVAAKTNYILLAESMLLFSFVTSIGMKIGEISFIIALVGIVITFSWCYLSLRTQTRIALLKRKYLVKNDPVYWDYVKTAFLGIPESYFTIWILPNTILLLWIYLLFYTFNPTGNILIKTIFTCFLWEVILACILGFRWYGISKAKSNISKPDC